ncbi:MAG: oxidoreductase, partial [Rhodanobacteraceae bacterium]
MTAMERDPRDRSDTTAEKLSVRVADKRLVATDVACLELVRADGGELPEFTPGAHIAL